MVMSIGETSNYDRINDYASVRISLAVRKTSRVGLSAKSKSRKRSTTEPTVPRKTACSANGSLAPKRTGNAPAANTAA